MKTYTILHVPVAKGTGTTGINTKRTSTKINAHRKI